MFSGYGTTIRSTSLFILTAMAAVLVAVPATAQRAPTTIEIPAVEPFILSMAMEQAVDGDTLLLVTPGDEGAYLDTTIHLTKSVVIKGDASLATPPRVEFYWEGKEESGSGNQIVLEQADLHIEGVAFGRMTADTVSAFIHVADGAPRTIRLHDTEFGNASRWVRQETAAGLIDTVLISDTYVHDIVSNAFTVVFAADAPNYVKVHNSTFSHIRNGFDLEGGGANSVLDVDHVTVDHMNISFDAKDATWSTESSIRNSLFTNGRTVIRWEGTDSTHPDSALVTNTLYFEMSRPFAQGATENETILAAVDPLYVSADTWPYDYSFQEGSPAIGAATDGTNLGDLRWSSTNTAADVPDALPHSIVLEQNYPNPFNPSTAITFELASPARVTLAVYDPLGRVVARPLDSRRAAGRHTVHFDATDLPSGTYFYRLVAGKEVRTRTMTVIK